MKKIFYGTFFAAMLIAGGVLAQETQPPGFSDFWKKFQSAVAKEDREAVASMTVLPFYWGESLDRAGFIKAYPKLFAAKTRQCFQKGKSPPGWGDADAILYTHDLSFWRRFPRLASAGNRR